MNIKEGYRYQKFLDKIIENLSFHVSDERNVIKTTRECLKNEMYSEAKNEIIEVKPKNNDYDILAHDAVHFINELISQKLDLSLKINIAKEKTISCNGEYDFLKLDPAIEYNKNLRSLANSLRYLLNFKSNETIEIGTDLKFNAEGNQVEYKHKINVVNTINYDRNVIKKLYKKILKNADDLSNRIEEFMLNSTVNFCPVYDVNDSVAEVVEMYLQKVSKNDTKEG